MLDSDRPFSAQCSIPGGIAHCAEYVIMRDAGGDAIDLVVYDDETEPSALH